MLDKPSVYNVLAEGIYFLDQSSQSNFNFLDFLLLVWIPHVIFETRSQLLYKLYTIL